MATKEELDERRVKEAHKKWQKIRTQLEDHMQTHEEVFKEFFELADNTNAARKKFEQAVRETGFGYGPISVVTRRHVEYDADYLEKLFADDPILKDLVVVKKSVQGKVFDNLVADKRITPTQVQKAVLNSEKRISLNGVPTEIVLP